MSGISDEAKTGQLLLHLPLRLIVTQKRRGAVIIGVVVEVTKGRKKGMLLGLGLLAVHLLECLLIESLLRPMLARVIVALVLALAGVILVGEVVVLLGAVGDKVVGISTVVAPHLLITALVTIQAVVLKLRELANDQCQLVIPKGLQLLL